MGRGKGRRGNHEGRGNNNSRSWRESIDEINHVPEIQDMTPMIQSQIPSVQPSPPPPAQAPQQFEIGFASASVGGVKKSRLYGIDSEISTYSSIASFSDTSPTTGHSHELEDQLQLMQEENKLLRDQFKDLQYQHQKIQEQNQKMQEEMRKQMQEEMRKQMQEMQRQMQEQMKSQLAAFFRGDHDE